MQRTDTQHYNYICKTCKDEKNYNHMHAHVLLLLPLPFIHKLTGLGGWLYSISLMMCIKYDMLDFYRSKKHLY